MWWLLFFTQITWGRIVYVEWRPLHLQPLPVTICVNDTCSVRTFMDVQAHRVSFEWLLEDDDKSVIVNVPDRRHKFSLSIEANFDCYIVSQQWDPERSLGEVEDPNVERGCRYLIDPPWVTIIETFLWFIESYWCHGLCSLCAAMVLWWVVRRVSRPRRKGSRSSGELRVGYHSKRPHYQRIHDTEQTRIILSESNILKLMSEDPDISSVRVAYTS